MFLSVVVQILAGRIQKCLIQIDAFLFPVAKTWLKGESSISLNNSSVLASLFKFQSKSARALKSDICILTAYSVCFQRETSLWIIDFFLFFRLVRLGNRRII